ncbi:uncharacterized protein IL334_005071 [Kwoniella shivajii]|uniref:Uncharacterized protein n=1 Tax=Kwoniella shivajii TaxID=564305 RepID=A0ABZ1D249_9TREE|nr:hypothetical protein IL334_005071 [Kwoniella shivajii]
MNTRLLSSSMGGPSRLLTSFASTTRIINPTHSSRRYLLTFPHPDLDSSKGSTKLIIKSIEHDIPSMIDAFTIIKAVEQKLNTKILDLSIPKDYDSLKHGSTIFITMLRPVSLSSNRSQDDEASEEHVGGGGNDGGSLLFEIPLISASNLSGQSNFLGGPSLTDIETALLSSSPRGSPSNISIAKDGKQPETIRVKVEIQRNAQRDKKRILRRARYSSNGKEASDIVKQLKGFKGGFYGGFDGLYDKFSHLEITSEQSESQSSTSTSAAATTTTASPASTRAQSGTQAQGNVQGDGEVTQENEQSEEASINVEQVIEPFQEVEKGEIVEDHVPGVNAPTVKGTSTGSSGIPSITESPGLSKAQIAREKLREAAIASAQRDLEIQSRKQKEAREAASEAERFAEEKREDAQRSKEGERKKDEKEGGFFGGVFGKRD